MDYKYPSKSLKIENHRKAKQFEDLCNKAKLKFDDIVKKIKRQDQALLESARTSMRMSNLRQDSFSQPNDKLQVNIFKMNGNDILDNEIVNREKQINLINK